LPRTSLSRAAAAAFLAGVDDGRLRPRRGADAGQPGLSPQGPGAAPQRPAAQAHGADPPDGAHAQPAQALRAAAAARVQAPAREAQIAGIHRDGAVCVAICRAWGS